MSAVVFCQPIEEYPAHLAFSNAPTMTNVDSNFPASKLLTYDPTAVARTTSGSTVITWDFLTQREFNVVSLLFTNTSYAATLVIEGSNNGTSWTVLQASRPLWAHRTTIPGSWSTEDTDPRAGALLRNHSWYYNVAGHKYRFVRLTVADPNVANITIGRLFVGRAYTPSTGMQYGSSFTFNDTGRTERTDQGAMILEAGSKAIVTASVKTEFLTSDEMYSYVYDFEYWRGGCREMLACLDVDNTARLQKNILYCVISEGRTISSDAFNCHSKTWNLESLA